MSYVYRKTGSKVWYIGYKDARGRQVRVATKAATKTEAQHIADDLERRAERVRLGLEAPPQRQVEWTEVVDRYLVEAAPRLAGYKGIVSTVKQHVREAFAGKTLTEITAGDVGAFDASRIALGLKPGTREQIRIRISAVFAFAKLHKLASNNPAGEFGKIEIPEAAIRHFEPHQVPLLIAEIAPHWRLPAAIAVMCGMRKGEVAGLTVEQLDFEGRSITIDRQYDGQVTKTKRIRLIPMPEMLVSVLQGAVDLAMSGRLFPWMKLNSHAAAIIRSAAKRAGLPELGFKELRSTWGTISYEATGDLRYVQKGLGHTNSDVTDRRYAHFSANRALTMANEVASHSGLTGMNSVLRAITKNRNSKPGSDEDKPPTLSIRGRRNQLSSGVLSSDAGYGGLRPGADVVDGQTPSVLPGSAPVSPPQLTEEPPLDVRETAHFLSISMSTVRKMIADGRLVSIKRGRYVRIPMSSIRALRRT